MIKFSKITKQFDGEKPALDKVSFEIDAGELAVITGPSGSGKTTLLKLLTREYTPSNGEVYFQDENVGSLKDSGIAAHRRKIGAVFQDYKLLPELNVWENIALALSIVHRSDSEIAEKVTDLLKLVGLEDKAYLFPHQLSGGEAQRISIARALSTAPVLIFADEPTGNLDAVTSLIIAKLLRKINHLGTTVLVTTHDPVVISELSKARHLNLEGGVLKKDSGAKHKKEEKSSTKGEEAPAKKEEKNPDKKDDKHEADKKDDRHEADKKETEVSPTKDDQDKKENKKKDQDIAPTEKSTEKLSKKSKKGFNFFGLFGKKKKPSVEEKPAGKDEVSKKDEAADSAHKDDKHEADKKDKGTTSTKTTTSSKNKKTK
jgi:cell division transport system ATP-binding protein